LYYRQQIYMGKRNADNQPILRPVKSVLVLEEVGLED
jgi:hypothetical protein